MPENSKVSDLKPRSRDVTDGLEKTAARGMLRAVGMGDEDWEKPQIGVASSWNEITPCNLSLDRLARGCKDGVFSGGGFPMQFGTISVSDGISMGHEGMHFSLVSREVIADSVETVMQAERLDGSVLLAGCDKSLPGMLMAAAPLDPRGHVRAENRKRYSLPVGRTATGMPDGFCRDHHASAPEPASHRPECSRR
jgi:dihydroxy-acid dehydratase